MKSSRDRRPSFTAVFLFLLCTTPIFAAPTELRILLDSDNSAATGCRVITNLGNLEGVDAIYTTTYDLGSDGKPVVTGVSSQTCAQKGTVNFTAPTQLDPGGWPVATDSSGNVFVETRIPTSALPAALHSNMRWYFIGVSGTNLELVVEDENDHQILFPAPPLSHPRIVGPQGARVITMDGKADDWLGIKPLVSGLALTGSGRFRFLGGVTAYATAQNLFFNFAIQSNSNAPQANDDGYTVLRGKSLPISAPGVLANDTDPNHKPLTATLISGPQHATSFTLNPDGSFTYVNDGSNAPHDSFRYKANNGSADSNTALVTIDIVDNRPPVAQPDTYNVTHGGTLNVPPPGVLINDSDPDGDPILPQVATPPAHGTVTLNNDGSFTYTHDGSNTTSDQFLYHDFDPFTVSNLASVTLTVGPDLPPVAVNDSGYVVAEGGTLNVSGLPNTQSLFNNDTDADSPKTLFSAVVSTPPAHGTVTITAGGGFNYTHDGSETTSDSFQYTLSDGIMNAATPATVSITITPGDDAPVNSVPGGQTLLEDGSLTFSSGNANAITISDPDAGASNVQVTLTATNGTVTLGGTAGLVINGGANGSSTVTFTGTIAAINVALNGTVYAPSANYNGAATLTVTTSDLGNTGAGGPLSDTDVINLIITPVNDVPSFSAGAAVTVLEDSGAYSAPWATGISAGPADEAGQTLNFVLTNNTNPSLFSVAPAVSPTGVLTFTPAANANGSATITFTLHDSGGVANGGVDTSAGQFVTINVTAVNDAPSFVKGGDESVSEDTGAHSVSNWATSISAGPADEAGQTLIFNVSNNNNALFTVQPGVDAAGTLTYTLAADASGTALVTISLSDSGGIANGGVDTSANQTFNIVVNGVDDAPVITRPATATTNEDTPFTFNGGNTISVADTDAQGGSETVTLGVSNGTLTLSGTTGLTVSGNGSNSITASGTLANLNAALNGLVYAPAANYFGGDTLNIGVNDNGNTGSGGPLTDSKSVAITVNSVNDVPVVTAGTTVTFTENGSPVVVASSLTVTDVDSPQLQGATIQITGNLQTAEDVLAFTPVGAIIGNYVAGTGTLTLSGTDTLANYQTALRSVTYANSSDNPNTSQRTITFIATDTAAGSSAGATSAVNVTAVNDAPVLTAGGTLNFTENQAPQAIDTTITVSDVDSANITGATVQITGNYINGEDILGFANTVNITGNFVAASGTLTLTGTDTLANYQAALRSVTYFNGSDNPNTGARTVSWQVNDGGAVNNLSNIPTSTINVTPANDVPVVTAGTTVSFTENGSPVVVAGSLTVTDVDSTQLSGATIQITGNLQTAEDVLAFTPVGAITGNYVAGTGTLTLSGTDSLANYQTALRSVTYANSSDNPNTSQRTLTFIATDTSAGSSAGATSAVNITAVNDAPVITRPATATTNEDAAFTFNGGNTISVADVDAQAGSETVTLSVTNGVLTLSGTAGLTVSGNGTASITASGTLANLNAALNGMTYTPTPDYFGSDTLNIGVNDGGNTGTGGPLTDSKSVAITVNSVPDAPIAVADTYSTNEDTPLVVNAASGVLANDTDIDTPHASLTAILNVGPANASSFTLNSDGSFNYTPNANFAGSDSFTYHANDGTLNSNAVTVSFTVTAVNDAPVITRPATATTNEDTAFTFNGGNVISIADVDAGAGSETVTLSVTNGVMTLSGTAGLTVSGNGTASITASGTLTNLNAALNGSTYTPNANYFGGDTLTIGVNDNGNTGTGGALTDSKTVAITVNSVPDAPVAVADSYGTSEDNPLLVNAASGVLANDTDVDTPHASLTAVLNVGPASASSFTLNSDGSFSYTPNANFSGSDSFTYHANDGGLNSNVVSVTIIVTAVNDAPVNSMPAPPTMNQDSTYTLTGVGAIQISDLDAGANPVQVALTATNGTMTLNGTAGLSFTVGDGTADAAMTFTGTISAINTALNGMQFASSPGFFGTASINIVTNDQGNTGAGGALSDNDTLNITVLQVNQAPVNSVPGTQTTNEDTSLTFNSGNSNLISISDPDAGANPVQVTLSVTNGTLSLSGITGLSFTVGDGTTDTTMTFTGTISAINTALNGLVYAPTGNFNGSSTLTITTNDQGNTGPGGPMSDTDTVTINVTPVDDAPVAVADSYSVNEGSTLTISIASLPGRPIVTEAIGTSGRRRAVTPPAGLPPGGPISADVTTGVLNNDTDIDTSHASLTAILVTGPAHASSFTLNSNGTFTYVHDGTETTTDSFTYKANDGLLDSNVATATITINPVNDAPVNTVPGTLTTNEDAALTFSSGNGNAISTSDPDAGASSVTVTVSVTGGTGLLGAIPTGGVVITNNNTASVQLVGSITNINTALNGLVYTPAANFNGSTTLTILTNDGGFTGAGGAQTDTDGVAINVTAVNDAPVITRPATVTASEDVAFTFNGGNVVSIADVDAGAGTVTVTLSVTSGTLNLSGTTGLAPLSGNGTNSISATGTLTNVNNALNGMTYTGTANFNGSDTLNIGVTDNGNTGTGGPLTDSKSTAITVTAVNDAPVNTVPGTQTFDEDTTLTFSTGNGNAISVADLDAAPGNVTVTLTTTAGTMTFGSVVGLSAVTNNAATITGTGTLAAVNTALQGLVFTPTLNINGAQTISLTTSDNGNTGTGGTLTDVDVINLTINAVNDAPTITRPATITVNEDTQFTFTGGNAITAADVDIAAGTMNLTISATNGTITLTTGGGATINTNGTASVTASGTLAQINAALANSKYQGNLNFYGSDTISINVNDNGNTGTGGALQANASISVTVSPVNDPPVAVSYCASGCTNGVLPAQAGIKISFGAGKLGGSDEAHEVTDGSVVSIATTPDTNCAGCTLVINANGSFDFTPPPSAAGTTVSFTYHVNDTGFPGPGVSGTPVTVAFNVAGPAIYFVKNAAVGAGDCKLGSECLFATAVTNIGVSTNAIIFMEDANSHTPAAVTLNSGGMIIGQGVVAASFDAFFGINGTPGSGGTLAARPAINAARPTLTNSPLTLNTNSQARGFNINNNAGDSLIATAKTGLVVSDMNIVSNANAGGSFCVNFTGATTGTFTFGDISVNAGRNGNGVNFNGVTSASTVTFNNITMGGSGNAFAVTSSGTTAFTVNNVTGSSGTSVSVTTAGNGAFTFNDVTSTTGRAVNVATATGPFVFHAINANGAATGILVTGATGSFTVNGTSTTAGTGGTIQNCTAKGADFRTSSNVTLKNMNFTGNGTGNLTVGTTCGDALNGTNGPTNCNGNISLLTVTTATLNNVTATNSKQIGIDVNGGSNLTLTNVTSTGNGDEAKEDGVQIVNLSGTLGVTGGLFRDNAANQFEVQNGAGALTVNIDSSTFSNTTFPTGVTTPSNTTANGGIFLATHNAATMSPTITNCTVDRIYAQGIRLDMAGTSSMVANIGPAAGAGNGNGITNSNQAISITGSNTGGITYNIRNNTMNINTAVVAGGATNQIGVAKSASGGTWTGVIENNSVGTAGVANSGCQVAGCNGIDINNNNSAGAHKLQIKSNQVHDPEGSGISVTSGGGTDSSANSWIITNNTITNPDQNAGAANPGIIVLSGSSTGTDTTNTCANISGNTITGTWSLGTGHLSSIRVRSLTTAAGAFALVGFNTATNYPDDPTGVSGSTTGAAGNVGNVADYIRSLNPAVTNASPGQNAVSATQGAATFSNSGGCP